MLCFTSPKPLHLCRSLRSMSSASTPSAAGHPPCAGYFWRGSVVISQFPPSFPLFLALGQTGAAAAVRLVEGFSRESTHKSAPALMQSCDDALRPEAELGASKCEQRAWALGRHYSTTKSALLGLTKYASLGRWTLFGCSNKPVGTWRDGPR